VCCRVVRFSVCMDGYAERMVQSVAACHSALQRVAACCSVLQCAAVCCSMCCSDILRAWSLRMCSAAVCCGVLQRVAACSTMICSVL